MLSYESAIALFCFVVLILVLCLLCVPLLEIPIPAFLQEFECVRRFFEWDSIDPNATDTLDDGALRQFLRAESTEKVEDQVD